MKKIDYILQNERIRQAKKYLIGNSIFDIGCHEGELFKSLKNNFNFINCKGIDTILKEKIETSKYILYPGQFPDDFKYNEKFDNITLLAVMEHIPYDILTDYPRILSEYLNKNGRIIITMPSKYVDYILEILVKLKLIHGMDLENHQEFDRNSIIDIFTNNGFKLIVNKKFEFGLNFLFVFEKQ